jgi:hypothetical protein
MSRRKGRRAALDETVSKRRLNGASCHPIRRARPTAMGREAPMSEGSVSGQKRTNFLAKQ